MKNPDTSLLASREPSQSGTAKLLVVARERLAESNVLVKSISGEWEFIGQSYAESAPRQPAAKLFSCICINWNDELKVAA
jgi:hypothetical protein